MNDYLQVGIFVALVIVLILWVFHVPPFRGRDKG